MTTLEITNPRRTGDSERDLLRGLVYSHNRANANTAELHQACATLQALVELLVERGVLEQEELTARREQAAEQLRGQYLTQGMATAMQEFGVSKYAFQDGAEIDCASRIHLCRAACCRLPLALSREDVQEGLVRWDLGQPYTIARDGDGYCVHLERQTCRCTVYDQRPIPCQGYDCRNDRRIWLDFESKVINPGIYEPDWPACLEVEDSRSMGERTVQ
jgi:Fe-S-cluster containining protein